jgi:hypothetical protein
MSANTAEVALKSGLSILEPLMRAHGFSVHLTGMGSSSGGPFATAEYRRGNRRLEVHYRHTLGLITYHLGSASLSHEDYMWSVLGQRWASHYPGFSSDPLDGFRHLREDLEQYAHEFLEGPDIEFLKHIDLTAAAKNSASRLP